MAYKSYSEIPWYQRAILKVMSTGEQIGKKAAGIVGLEDYTPEEFSNVKSKIETELAQKGSTEGWDWREWWKGTLPHKLYDTAFGPGESDIEKYGETSMPTGGAITGATGGMPQGGVGQPIESGESLGRRLAVQEEPALEENNFNYNNFSF